MGRRRLVKDTHHPRSGIVHLFPHHPITQHSLTITPAQNSYVSRRVTRMITTERRSVRIRRTTPMAEA